VAVDNERAAGVEHPVDATEEIIGPLADQRSTGLPPGVAGLACEDAEEFYQGLFAQLEAEARAARPRRFS
jgi:hypothetical protein